MDTLESILNEALKDDATELIVESGKEVQLVKQNHIQALARHGVRDNVWIQNIAQKVLGDKFPSLSQSNPQRSEFPFKDFGSIRVVARIHGGTTLRFFLPPSGEQLCEQYWETITAGGNDEALDMNLSGVQSEDFQIDVPNLEAETPKLEIPIEIPTEPEIKAQDGGVPPVPFNMNDILNFGNTEAEAPTTPPPTEKPAEETEIGLAPDLGGLDLTPTDAAPTNIESAPASEPLPPLPLTPEAPPLVIPEPIPVPEVERVPEPLTLNTQNTPVDTASIDGLLEGMKNLNASHLHLCSGQVLSFRIQDKLVANGTDILNEDRIHTLLETIIPEDKKESWKNTRETNFLMDWKTEKYGVHLFKDLNGTSVVLRSISSKVPSFQEILLPPRVSELCEFKHGLVLIAGPSESLLASILAAVTGHIGSFRQGRIISLETQIRYLQNPQTAVISQRQVGLHTNSLASGLRSALQENPDLITLSNLGEHKSASLALKASAETLVFAGLNAHSLAEARAILDSLLSDSPKLLVDAVLRDILFAKPGANGSPEYDMLIAPAVKATG